MGKQALNQNMIEKNREKNDFSRFFIGGI